MEDLIISFYTAFNNLNPEGMVACYHPEVTFHDPAFGTLKGERAKNMWRMLCKSQQGKAFKVQYSNIKVEGNEGSCDWNVSYIFGKPEKQVVNRVHAVFEFKDGLIYKHTDEFDLHKWAKLAMGFKGSLLGGTAYFKTKFQYKTNAKLDAFIKKQQV
ncbi:nuclear transport factor 2 family protein [Formosa sp. S-31]|uniref:nuclear transport factor 2 family protein n=1 Tax=Formosa sp. S-31 TaxID=2790949 RepID=UPI003EBD4179